MQLVHCGVLANILTNRQFFLTSSTDNAAAAINGTNLHAAICLPVKVKEEDEYRKPADHSYSNLKIVIEDEICMFGLNCSQHLHIVLQHIY